MLAELLRADGRRGLRRAAAGEGLGRARRPVHRRGPADRAQAAPQARRPPVVETVPGRGVPDPMSAAPRLTLRARLTLLYGGLFLAGRAGAARRHLPAVRPAAARRLFDEQARPRRGRRAARPPAAGSPGRRSDARPAGRSSGWLERAAGELRAAAITSLLTQGAIALVVVGGRGGRLGWLIAGRVLAPLHRVTETARRIAAAPAADRGLHERIALAGPRDEVKELADTFDTMVERLDQVLRRAAPLRRQRLARAAHPADAQPGAGRAGHAPAGRPPPDVKQLGESLLEINARHERLIAGLLLLARLRARDHRPVAGRPGRRGAPTSSRRPPPEAAAAEVTVREEAGPAPDHRRRDAARTAGAEPGRERHPAQHSATAPAGCASPAAPRAAQVEVEVDQHRPGRPAVRGPGAVRAVPPARRRPAGRPARARGWACPSSARSPAPTAATWSPARARAAAWR